MAFLSFCVAQLKQLHFSFGLNSGPSLISKHEIEGPRAGSREVEDTRESKQSETRANIPINTFPATIFQLAWYRSASKPLAVLWLSQTGLVATLLSSCVEISPHSGGGQAGSVWTQSRYARVVNWLGNPFHLMSLSSHCKTTASTSK